LRLLGRLHPLPAEAGGGGERRGGGEMGDEMNVHLMS